MLLLDDEVLLLTVNIYFPRLLCFQHKTPSVNEKLVFELLLYKHLYNLYENLRKVSKQTHALIFTQRNK